MNNPFALFDLPVSFEVDQERLTQRYLTLQKSVHPDNFSSSSDQEQRLALQRSAEINDALGILKDPIRRADSIIAIQTGKIENIEEKSNKDIDFLMQQMEWRERLDEIEQSQNAQDLADFTTKIEQTRHHLLAELSAFLNAQQWQSARELTDKLRFIKKLMVEIERVEENLLDF